MNVNEYVSDGNLTAPLLRTAMELTAMIKCPDWPFRMGYYREPYDKYRTYFVLEYLCNDQVFKYSGSQPIIFHFVPWAIFPFSTSFISWLNSFVTSPYNVLCEMIYVVNKTCLSLPTWIRQGGMWCCVMLHQGVRLSWKSSINGLCGSANLAWCPASESRCSQMSENKAHKETSGAAKGICKAVLHLTLEDYIFHWGRVDWFLYYYRQYRFRGKELHIVWDRKCRVEQLPVY